MASLKDAGTISAKRTVGFGLDRLISVMFLGAVPLGLDASTSRGALFSISFVSVIIAAMALVFAGSQRGFKLFSHAEERGLRTASVVFLGVLVALGGLGCLLCLGRDNGPETILPYTASVLALGIGSALLVFLWGIVFSRVGAKTTLVEASLGYLIAFFALLPFHALPLAGQIAFVIVAASANTGLLASSLLETRSGGNQSEHLVEQPASEDRAAERAWLRRICAGLFLYGSAMACFGQIQLANAEVTLSVPGTALQAIAALAACAATFAAVLLCRSRSEALGYRFAFIATMIGCLLPLVFPPDAAAPMTVMLAGETTMLVVISSLLFEFAHQTPWAAARILSLGITSKVCGDLLTRALIELGRELGVTAGIGTWTLLFAICIIAEYTIILTEPAIQTALHGASGTFLPCGQTQQHGTSDTTARISHTISAQFNLTDRESEVLYHLLRGRSSRRIQEELFISESTANTHIRHIYGKLGVHSKQELLDLADTME